MPAAAHLANRWVRRRSLVDERAKRQADARNEQLAACSRTVRVVVSLAIGEETPTCAWVDALLLNVLAFTRTNTAVMLHISSRLLCSAADLRRWTSADLVKDRLVAVNPSRLPTRGGHGSVLYAHLLNARSATARWQNCCCYFVLQASNMLWVRSGMEARVESLRCSVGREGWRKPNIDMPLLIAGYHRGTAGDVLTARLYHNLTRSRYPMTAREIFAVKSKQPEKRAGDGERVSRFGWSYHEGAFYPYATVMRFLAHLEASLSMQQIMDASNSPEEWWLQAWALNREPPSVPIQPVTQQLCLRLNISQNGSHVTAKYVQKMYDDLMCPQPPGAYRYYALKRFARNASNELTAQALRLSRDRRFHRTVTSTNASSAECIHAHAARRRLP